MKYSLTKQSLQYATILLLSCTMIISCDNNKKSSTTTKAKVYAVNEKGDSISFIDL